METPLAPPARDLPAPPCGRDRSRGADEPAEQERACAAAPVLSVHGTIVRVRIATIGDVMLDVIVRLEGPLAAGGDVPPLVVRFELTALRLLGHLPSRLGRTILGQGWSCYARSRSVLSRAHRREHPFSSSA